MKNRYNTPQQPMDYSPKKKEKEEVILVFEPCCVCYKKIIDGYYARWYTGGVCSKECDTVMENKPRLHGGKEIINGKEWL